MHQKQHARETMAAESLYDSEVAIAGTIIYCKSLEEIVTLPCGVIIFDNEGLIKHVIEVDMKKLPPPPSTTHSSHSDVPQIREDYHTDHVSFSIDHNRAYLIKTAIEAVVGEDGATNINITDYGHHLIIPGFIDTHIHAPQWVTSGTGMDEELMTWLQKYTLPNEQRFEDDDVAGEVYHDIVSRTLRNGTTTASYWATIHEETSLLLAAICRERGQRAFIGKVSMDQNGYDRYVEETGEAIDSAESFVRRVLEMTEVGSSYVEKVIDGEINEENQDWSLMNSVDAPLIMPVLTPRFVPTCSPELMTALGSISRKYGVPIQSHLSESKGEIAFVKELHPDCSTYAGVYDKHGLLHEYTYMAHSVYSDQEERNILKAKGVGVCHCASSNYCLSSGIFNSRCFLAEELKVGLGTDVAGGYSCHMLDALRQSINASINCTFNKSIENHPMQTPWVINEFTSPKAKKAKEEQLPLSWQEAFYMATLGGAEVLNLDKVVGSFEVGKKVDALVINLDAEESPIDVYDFEGVSSKFQKFLYNGDGRNIERIYINGKIVQSSDEDDTG